MAPGFSFPPPPPPPPKSTSAAPDYPSASRGGTDRGRGRGGGFRGGRGGSQAYSAPPQNSYPPGSYINPNFQPRPADTSDDHHGQKRKREQASWRGGPRPARGHPMKVARPAPPPAVPSFGAPLTFTTNADSTAAPPEPLPAPFAPSPSPPPSDSDSEDEEAAFLQSTGGALRFEHDGEIITLSSAADIAAWTEARRKQFPTSRRGREKDDLRRQRAEERRRIEDETARAAGVVVRPRMPAQQKPIVEDELPVEDEVNAAGPSLGLGGYSSSEDEDNGPPETVSSRPAPAAEAPPRPPALLDPKIAAILRPPPMCKFFAQHGHCRMGARCKFSHGKGEGSGKEKGRKTLYQRLLEQEQQGENTLAVKAIRYLGELGFFRPKNAPES